MTVIIGRRELLTAFGGVAVAWPLAAHAQQSDRVRRIGVLMGFAADDPAAQARVLGLVQALAQSGWTDGRNVHIDIRWGAADPERIRRYAAELVALAPDVVLAAGSPATGPLLQATGAIPIVFVQVADPVGAGFVASLARPSGNATGFMVFEYGIGGKWLELLKEIAPGVKRVAFLRNLATPTGSGAFGVIQASASSLGMEVTPINVRDAGEIERDMAAFARSANSGLIVLETPLTVVHRNLIITLAAQHRLPTVYTDRIFVTAGGLISYGPDRVDQYRRAAGYVDRILKGEKPADLKAATATVPIVFNTGEDPVKAGAVAALNRPGGNATGVSLLTVALEAKRLQLLHELVPTAAVVAIIVNPNNSQADQQLQELQAAARTLGVQIEAFKAGTPNTAFANVVQRRAGALHMAGDAFFNTRREQFVVLSARHALPTGFSLREFPAAGGLMSYGPSLADAYRQQGIYAGRILKGEKPAEMPVEQAVKSNSSSTCKPQRHSASTFRCRYSDVPTR